jgi:3',5'-cyclic AMP phosphodiesterase CpdA
MNETTILAQVTDLHIRQPGKLAYGRLDTAPYLRRAVQAIGRLRQQPDAVVLTGDLTDFGRAEEYEHLASLLAPLTMPVYLLPGNHDEREQMRRSFPSHTYLGTSGPLQYSVRVGGLRLVTLDTVVPRQSGGALPRERLDWLERELAKDETTPTVVAMHHPPFKTMIGHMDRIGLAEGAQDLEAIVGKHRNIERVICGHLHRTILRRFGGTIASTCPSPAHQVALDLVDTAASQWELEPPQFQLHAWNERDGLVTHVASIGEFEGPFPFHEPGGALID